jgi:phage baseplate assembly protein W
MATINRTTQIFRDFDLAFSSHPNTEDLAVKRDAEAVKQSLRNLILTQYYERPFHSEIGSPIRSLLFEFASPLTVNAMRRAIIDVISNFEPRVAVDDVQIFFRDANNECTISIQFRVVGLQSTQQLDILIERTR